MNNYLCNYQNQLHSDSQLVYVKNVAFLDRYGIKPSPIYEEYWNFAAERQAVFNKRKNGTIYPWTNNHIIQKYKFTNVYRASDRVSQYLIRNVIYPEYKNDFTPEDIFFRIILFKLFKAIPHKSLKSSKKKGII